MPIKVRSEAYTRGRDFETRIAKLIRQKLGIKAIRDPRSGAGQVYKADIAVPGMQVHIEAKSQKTIKLGEWWSQTIKDAGYKVPVLMIELGGYEDLVALRINDYLDMVKVTQDDSELIKELQDEVGKLRGLQKEVSRFPSMIRTTVDDWEWLCRKCHQVKDGRLERFMASRPGMQEFCGNGHKMEESNLYWFKDKNGKPYRKCKQCNRAAQQRNYRYIKVRDR
jgi:hypothetical protein